MSETAFPILNIYAKTAEYSQNLVQDLRQKFLERVEKNPEFYYSEDVDRVKTNDWYVRRYMFEYNSDPDISKALERMDRAMKWRKEFGVRQLSDRDVPKEMYLSAGGFIYGKDLNGSTLVIMRGKVYKPIKSWREHSIKSMVYFIEKFDSLNAGKGVTILTDCRDAGVHKPDMDLIKFGSTLMNDYYPGLIYANIVYKMPKMLEGLFKLYLSFLNEEQRKYVYLCGKKKINNYVAVDQLPDFLMGTNTQSYRIVPPDSPTAHELAERIGIRKEKADKLVKHLEKFYDN